MISYLCLKCNVNLILFLVLFIYLLLFLLIYFLLCSGAQKMLLVFYNKCHFCFLSTTPVTFYQYYKMAEKKKKKKFFHYGNIWWFHKTQPSRLTVGQLEIPKKVQVNFPNWFQNNIVYIIESNTFQKP